MRSTIIKYSLLLLAGQLVCWWIFFFSPFNIPEKIPYTPINISGLILVALLLSTLILAQKKCIQLQPEISIMKLTLLGSIICFSSEIIFQTVRQPTLIAYTLNEHVYYFLLGVIGITCFGAILSFMIAFQLKTKKTKQLVLMIIGFIVLTNLIQYFYPTFKG